MNVLKIRDENGKFIPINAIKGDDGKSAYEQAQEGGFNGTEEEFIAVLNGLTETAITSHLADTDKHVTTYEAGAITIGRNARVETDDTDSGVAIGSNAKIWGTGTAIGVNTCAFPYCTVVGESASAEESGTAVGTGAYAWEGAAVGRLAYAYSGGAVGDGARTTFGGAIGNGAYSTTGGAIGNDAYSTTGCAVGDGTLTAEGVAVGYRAKTSTDGTIDNLIDAIQLGTGTNPNEKTLQVYDYQLMDADGKIPSDRLPQRTYQYKGNSSSATRTISIGTSEDNELCITGGSGFAIVTPHGAIAKSTTSTQVDGMTASDIKYVDGVLTIATTNKLVNGSGYTYTCKVL